MGLEQLNFEGQTRVEAAIALLKAWQPTEPYQLCFSGGKDSAVIEHLARRAGLRFDTVYNKTGIDPPELVQFIREHYPNIIIEKPKMSVWKGLQIHGLPTRKIRWCCELLKESSGNDRMLVTGMRAAESSRRARRCIIETNRKGNKSYVNPIFFWSHADVWSYIHENDIPYCQLYDQGFERLGCILCPMTTHEHTLIEWQRWPKIAEAWFRAGTRYWEAKHDAIVKGHEHYTANWNNPNDYIWWWLGRGQVSIEEMKYKAGKMGLFLAESERLI